MKKKPFDHQITSYCFMIPDKHVISFFFLYSTASDQKLYMSLYLTLAEGEAGVDVLTVNSLQEAAAPVERRLLLPRLELTEQLTVHLHAR